MSSDNQYTALGPASIGFQTDSTNIQTGAAIGGNQIGAVILGLTTPTSQPICGVEVNAVFPDVTVDPNHIPPRTGIVAFGDGFSLVGMTGDSIRSLQGQVDAIGIPNTTECGVLGTAFNGPGVVGVAGGLTSATAPTDAIAPYLRGEPSCTGVMGACVDGPGVTGVSPKNPGVMGASDSVGVLGTAPAAAGYPRFLGNTRGIGVMGTSANTGVVGISTTGLKTPAAVPPIVNETPHAGVLGVGGGVGVQGVSYNDRGGVFETLPPPHQLMAQLRLVPNGFLTFDWSTSKLPTVAKAGDLLAVEVSRPVPVRDEPNTTTNLYFCTQSSSGAFPAKWSEVMLKPI
jgi:hypothetical protein